MSAGAHRAASRSTQAWTDERLDALTQLWIGGASAAEIARSLGGVSRSAVLGKVHRLGLGRPAPSRQPKPRQVRARKSRARSRPRSPILVADGPREVPTLSRPVRSLIVAANGNIYPAPPPIPLPPLRVVEALSPKGLLALGPRDCRHPINDGDDARVGWLYCGEPVTGKGDYCARCRTILFDHERTAQANAKGAAARDARRVGATRRVGRGDCPWAR